MRKLETLRPGTIIAAAFCLMLWAAQATPVQALDRGTFSLEILVDGAPLTEYEARERFYVEASEGREYSIRMTNRTARRVAVALSVDGLNSIDAKTTTAKKASKWILAPWQSITIDGWQTGASTARRFFFTTEEKSYGAWLGKTRNLGIISAAVYRERLPEPLPISAGTRQEKHRAAPQSAGLDDRGAPGDSTEAESMADADAPSAGKSSGRTRVSEAQPLPSREAAATGIGRQVDHRVRRVEFVAEATAATVMDLRYEYREGLIRLGALPYPVPYLQDPLERREQARGFDGPEFAPDPYR